MIGSKSHFQSGKIGRRGFTLIEILIALVLLGISIAVLAQLFSTNLRNIFKTQNYVPAIVVSEAIMNDIMAVDDIEEGTSSYKTDEGYVVEIAIFETMKDRFENMPVKLMEIDLTVRWRIDRKEKTFVLKSYKTFKRFAGNKEAEKENEEQAAE